MTPRNFFPLGWAALWLAAGILAVLVFAELPRYSTFGHIVLCIGMVECWDTLADHYRFRGFSTADELKRGNNAVALYFLARAILVVGCLYIGQSAL